ncbi:hypothetical protein D516_1839 [Rhodobacter sp. AKP1]|nr:hypothetical protein D516_1839 [Rhodobacter sp. AKP1]
MQRDDMTRIRDPAAVLRPVRAKKLEHGFQLNAWRGFF